MAEYSAGTLLKVGASQFFHTARRTAASMSPHRTYSRIASLIESLVFATTLLVNLFPEVTRRVEIILMRLPLIAYTTTRALLKASIPSVM